MQSSPSESPHPVQDPDEGLTERAESWRPRPNRLLIGFGLIAVGLVWSILNSVLGVSKSTPQTPTITHGTVATHVQMADGVDVGPTLPPNVVVQGPVEVDISFRNTGTTARAIAPADLRLMVAGKLVWPAGGRFALMATTLAPGHFVTGALYFHHALAPGATLVYTPQWDRGHVLRWLLWR